MLTFRLFIDCGAIRATWSIAALIALTVAGVAQSAPINVSTGQVQITYDDATSLRWSTDSQNSGLIGGAIPFTLGASVTQFQNGLLITAPNETSISSGPFVPEEATTALLFENVVFVAQPGFVITAYQLSFSGGYSSSGSASVSIPTGALDDLTTTPISGGQGGRFAYNVVRSPLSDLVSPQVATIGFSTFLEGDEAAASIANAHLSAVVVVVPEPATHGLVLCGLACLAAAVRRKKGFPAGDVDVGGRGS